MADVTVNGSLLVNHYVRGTRAIVMTTDQFGYGFFLDSTGLRYSKTSDGGQTWGSATTVVSLPNIDNSCFGIWFDRWTSGDSGTKIHCAATNWDNDTLRYRALNTSGDTLGTEVNVAGLAGY